jgi:hypothetical protein
MNWNRWAECVGICTEALGVSDANEDDLYEAMDWLLARQEGIENPIWHHTEDHVRAHIFLCMLAYHVEWHMRKALAPLVKNWMGIVRNEIRLNRPNRLRPRRRKRTFVSLLKV